VEPWRSVLETMLSNSFSHGRMSVRHLNDAK
jgi:hypothetical protein